MQLRNHFRELPLTRREMLQTCSTGFGAFAMTCLLADKGYAEPGDSAGRISIGTHHAAKAKNVIFLYMDGGVSQVDSFDPKPRLTKESGNSFPATKEPRSSTTMATPWARFGTSIITGKAVFR